MFLFDSREKKNEHVKKWFEARCLKYSVNQLSVGDYMIEGGTVSIDRKKDLSELLHNIFSKDKKRFFAEIERAKADGITLIILCEHGGKIKSLKDVAMWKSPYSRVSGRVLADGLCRLEYAYGVRTVFCSKRQTAKMIYQILTGKVLTF